MIFYIAHLILYVTSSRSLLVYSTCSHILILELCSCKLVSSDNQEQPDIAIVSINLHIIHDITSVN